MAESNWASQNAMEAPFWKNGMTIEEYEEERTYLYTLTTLDFQTAKSLILSHF